MDGSCPSAYPDGSYQLWITHAVNIEIDVLHHIVELIVAVVFGLQAGRSG